MRLLQPPRQVLLPDPGLTSQVHGAHCILAGEALDHFLLKAMEYGLVML
jgi:hypothetical protein